MELECISLEHEKLQQEITCSNEPSIPGKTLLY
jgi:hypothetical protein